MKILVTGGLGFIGSHTVIELIKNNHEIIIIDNLVNSKIDILEKLEKITGVKTKFYQIDATDEVEVEKVFQANEIEGVIHFAGLKSVGESVSMPLEYYRNNLVSTILISSMCLKYGVDKFVFSSSATVYGDQPSPLKEEMELKETTNPYGETKSMSERILKDTSKAHSGFDVTLLRYFNPVGAHESGIIGEDPNEIPNNLMPFLTRVAKGELEELSVFGNDYDTVDGTGVRDYIHVVDLAEGHVAAIENLTSSGVHIYNLGTGQGTSVLELINTFQEVNDVKIPYKVVERRSGDIAIGYADASKSEKCLNWKAKRTVRDMCVDSWRFENNKGEKQP